MGPDFPHSRVKPKAGDVTRAILPGDAKGIEVPRNQVAEIRMSDLNPFGDSGRSRSVDHVGKALGFNRRVCHPGSGRDGWRIPAGIDAACTDLETTEKLGSGYEDGCVRVFDREAQP